MNASDRQLLAELQVFLLEHVLKDATATAHHSIAEDLYARLRLLNQKKMPSLDQFEKWRASPENAVRPWNDPKLEAMVYAGLFPGRLQGLLTELIT